MKKFEVRLVRNCPQYYRVEIEAKDEAAARERALEKAPDLNFLDGTTGEAEYSVDSVDEVDVEAEEDKDRRHGM